MSYADALRLENKKVTLTLMDGKLHIKADDFELVTGHDQSEWPFDPKTTKMGRTFVLRQPNPLPEYYLLAFLQAGMRVPVILETGVIGPTSVQLN